MEKRGLWDLCGSLPYNCRGRVTGKRVIISDRIKGLVSPKFTSHEKDFASKTVKLYSRLTNRANNPKTNLSM